MTLPVPSPRRSDASGLPDAGGAARSGSGAAPRDAGFSLTETLIVVFIVGLMSGLVVLNFPARPSAAQADAAAFAARLLLAAEESVVAGEPMGLIVTPDAYRFVRYRAGAWRLIEEPKGAFSPRRWSDDVTVEAALADGADLVERGEITGVAPRRESRRLANLTPQVSGLPAPFAGAGLRAAPRVLFDPAGETTPLTLRLSDQDASAQVVWDAAGQATLSVEAGAP